VVKDLKELEKLLKLCRKQGVLELNIQGVAFKLGELPTKQQVADQDETETDQLQGDDLIYYSAGSHEAEQ